MLNLDSISFDTGGRRFSSQVYGDLHTKFTVYPKRTRYKSLGARSWIAWSFHTRLDRQHNLRQEDSEGPSPPNSDSPLPFQPPPLNPPVALALTCYSTSPSYLLNNPPNIPAIPPKPHPLSISTAPPSHNLSRCSPRKPTYSSKYPSSRIPSSTSKPTPNPQPRSPYPTLLKTNAPMVLKPKPILLRINRYQPHTAVQIRADYRAPATRGASSCLRRHRLRVGSSCFAEFSMGGKTASSLLGASVEHWQMLALARPF